MEDVETVITMLQGLKLQGSPKNSVEEHSAALIRDLLSANSSEAMETEVKRAYANYDQH
jgi:hypothetical protein